LAVGSFLVLVAFTLAGPIFGETSPALALTRAVNLTSPDATVGPPHQVADPVPGVPQTARSGPALAFDGTNHLAAWQDDRGGIWAARVSPSGEVLDPTGLPVNDRRYGRDPAIAFDGTNFLVVWAGDQSILGRRVSPDGAVLDAEDIALTTETSGLGTASVAFDGSNHLVVWTRWGADGTTLSDIAGRRVAPSGAIVDPGELVISATPTHQIHPQIAFNGTHHLVVWQTDLTDSSDISGTLVTPDGTPVGPDDVPIATAPSMQSDPVVTAVGASYYVAWNDRRPDAPAGVYGTLVDATGTAVDPAGTPIGAGGGNAAVASNGTDVLVAWDSGVSASRATRIDAAGTVLDPSGIALPSLVQMGVASDGANYLVAGLAMQLTPPTVTSNVGGTRVTPAGAVLDPTPITIAIAANAQRQLDMASGGDDRLVVWIDDRPDAPGLYGGRVGPDGEILDGAGFPIALGTDLAAPAVAFDGERFLVTWTAGISWSGGTAIVAALVTSAAEVSPPVTISAPDVGDVADPTVAFGGGTFLVGWSHYEQFEFAIRSQVLASRVSTDGAVLDPDGLRLTTEDWMWTATPSIAFGGSDFLVVWDQASSSGSTGNDIFGARVTTAGGVVDPGGFPISDAADDQFRPDVAWNGDRYLAVWEVRPSEGLDSDPTDVRGARITGDGVVEDQAPLAIAIGPDDQRAPSVAANGPFLVTWTQRREDGDTDVLATEVEPNGYIGHPGGFVVAGGPTPELDAVVTAASGERNFTVAAQSFVTDAPYGTYRAHTTDVHVSPK
jgi:hypothetical protein